MPALVPQMEVQEAIRELAQRRMVTGSKSIWVGLACLKQSHYMGYVPVWHLLRLSWDGLLRTLGSKGYWKCPATALRYIGLLQLIVGGEFV